MAVPKLRFKEFDGNWDKKLLGKIIGISSASRVFKDQWEETGVPFFRTSDVVSIFKNKENEKAYISLELFEELAKKSGKIQKDDLLVTGGGSIGIPYLVPNNEPLYFKDADLLWLKASGIINGSFLYNFFISPKFREYLKSISHTGTISHFTIEQAKATPFCFPIVDEQTKIASFLSSVDEKISQLTQKHQLLSQYKQGMMQKLFSQQIRFKADDGSEFGEWEDIQLKDISHRITRKNKELNQNALTISAQLGLINQQEYFSKQIASRDLSKYYLLHKGEYAYNKSYSAGYPMGAIKRLKLYDKGVVSTLYICFSLNEYINSDYFEQFVESGLLVPELEKIAQEGARNHGLLNISLQEFFEVNLKMPSLDEQAKIANFLSAIDQKIEIAAQQIEQAKQWKKGLLQQMFV
jgi:type I restriction enzyme S subunit